MKKCLIFLGVLCLVFTLFQIVNSFGLFETKVTSSTDLSIAKWHISVNESDLTGENKTFTVNEITYTDEEGMSVSKFAPGVKGAFVIVIDPKDTETSFNYYLSVNLSSVYPQIVVDEVSGINGTTLTLADGVYSGLASLSEIKASKKYYIKVTFSWKNSDEYNDVDSSIGSNLDYIEVPVSIKFVQYK